MLMTCFKLVKFIFVQPENIASILLAFQDPSKGFISHFALIKIKESPKHEIKENSMWLRSIKSGILKTICKSIFNNQDQ